MTRLCNALRPSLIAAAVFCAAAGAAEPQRVPVSALSTAPALDGDLAEWGKTDWVEIPIAPTVKSSERADLGLDAEDRNATGKINVRLKAGVADGRLYLALRWPDDAADTDVDVWVWSGMRYSRSRRFEDMFAVRFNMAGDYDRSMLSGKNYEADVWVWSSARSDPAGIAEDYRHVITTSMIDNAAEYSVKGVGTVYIKKHRDKGTVPYKTRRPPKTKQADQIPAIDIAREASGSFADVSAKGQWAAGFWSLELSRALDTGHEDDVVLPRGGSILGQIAAFNHAGDENKSISEPLLFDFSAIK